MPPGDARARLRGRPTGRLDPAFPSSPVDFTRLLMSAAALALGALGVLGSFAPDVVLRWAGSPGSPHLRVLVQLPGALFLGFAVLNWMTRDQLIGGIYNRPLLLANLLHFGSGALAVVKLSTAPGGGWLWPLALAYAGFASCFALLLFRHPVRQRPA